jgi:glutamyl-tRNA reductase
MSLLLLGFSHRTAPVEIRERYAVTPAAVTGLDEKLVRDPALEEAVLISTCNRTEILAVSSQPEAALQCLLAFFQGALGDGSAGPQHFYELRETDVVTHLLRVAASLDSMVVGEAQILGQLKQGYRAAVEAGSVGPVLNRLFQCAFRSAKRVRTQTGLGSSVVSVAHVGVHLARQLFESLEGKTVVLLGAGEMAESALRGLQKDGVSDVVILSRTREAAARLERRFSARSGSLGAMHAELANADVLLSSLQVERPILEPSHVEGVMAARHGRPLLMVDLGLPRNVASTVNEVENVYLYDIDDLEQVAEQGRADRQAAVAPALEILLRERDRFERWRASLPLVPTIRALQRMANDVARAEAQRLAGQFGEASADNREVLERLAQGIVAKLLHRPLERLRAESATDGGLYYADAVQMLFGLEGEEDGE